jgi:hypothetical protein
MGFDDPDLLARIHHFREAGVGVFPEREEYLISQRFSFFGSL